jgi:hypothetical protein
MRHLLLAMVDQGDEIRVPCIRAQQARLDAAAAEYRQARERYIEVMAFSAANGSAML